MVVKIEGAPEGVQAALEAGAAAADKLGQLLAMHMIPQTDARTTELLPYHSFLERYRGAEAALPAMSKPQPPRPAARPKRTPSPRKQSRPKPSRPKPSSKPQPVESSAELTWGEISALPVVKLRKYARTVTGLPIQGREISHANKEQLLEALRSSGKDRS